MKNTIALVYDFDGTLSPKSMQEYTILRDLGVKDSKIFWKQLDREAERDNAEKSLVWMRMTKELAEKSKTGMTREYFRKSGKEIDYFPGVPAYFKEVTKYVQKASKGRMKVRHYIVSAGLKEILEGISIRKEFHNIFASEYHYDERGLPTFPKVVITDTIKTQYLFRINKGLEKLNEDINQHMPEADRPIPFENIIYVGDGLTDVPAMTLTKKSGGHSIAVYRARHQKGLETCKRLLSANRVDFIANADYRKHSELFQYVTTVLDLIMKRYEYGQKVEQNRKRL
ncbi:MAG: haloacid dehalogenase-like hydrolase [Candidatus Omnitrophica bacterium]|nr:haloacid dehalogenase-like hydrolase [Candidatus Omnitrophota bacterium]